MPVDTKDDKNKKELSSEEQAEVEAGWQSAAAKVVRESGAETELVSLLLDPNSPDSPAESTVESTGSEPITPEVTKSAEEREQMSTEEVVKLLGDIAEFRLRKFVNIDNIKEYVDNIKYSDVKVPHKVKVEAMARVSDYLSHLAKSKADSCARTEVAHMLIILQAVDSSMVEGEMEKLYRTFALNGDRATARVCKDITGIEEPEYTEEEEEKSGSWSVVEPIVDGGDLCICEWNKECDAYVMVIPRSRYQNLSHMFVLSDRREDAERVFAFAKSKFEEIDLEQFKMLDDENLDPKIRYELKHKKDELIKHQSTIVYKETLKYARETVLGSPEASEYQMSRLDPEKDNATAVRLLNDIDNIQGDDNLTVADAKIKHIKSILDANKHMPDTQRDQLIALTDFLRESRDIEEKRAKELQATSLPARKTGINNSYDRQTKSAYNSFLKKVGDSKKNFREWRDKMIQQGLLRAELVSTSIYKSPLRGLVDSSDWEFMVRPVPGKNEQLKDAAYQLAIEKQNNKLYLLSESDRKLRGEDRDKAVVKKRAEVLADIKKEIKRAIKFGEGKVQWPFNTLFRGRFIGENELSGSRMERSQNKEFLKDLFLDPDFISSICERGQNTVVLRELVKMLKEAYPEEGDALAAATFDKFLTAREQADIEIGRSKGEAPEDGEYKLATTRFRVFGRRMQEFGIDVKFDQLTSVDVETIRKIEPVMILMDDDDELRRQYLELIKKHLGEQGVADMVKNVFFLSLIEDPQKKHALQSTAEFYHNFDTTSSILRFFNQSGVLDLAQARALVAEIEKMVTERAENGARSGYDTERELKDVRLAINSVFAGEIDASLTFLAQLGLDPAKVSAEQLDVIKAAVAGAMKK